VATFNFSAGTTSFTDTTETQIPDLYYFFGGPVSYNPTYQVQAHYAGGDSASTQPMPLLNRPNVASIAIISSGQSNLLVLSGLPAQAVALRLTRIGPWQGSDPMAGITATTYDLPVGDLSDGTYALSASQSVPTTEKCSYDWWVQTVSADRSPSVVSNK
jgi:hypothetical protein